MKVLGWLKLSQCSDEGAGIPKAKQWGRKPEPAVPEAALGVSQERQGTFTAAC